MYRIGMIVALAIGLSACSTALPPPSPAQEAKTPPDMKRAILENRGKLWKDPDSIKDASIGEVSRSGSQWAVCVRANAKNSYGGYTGLSDNIISVHDDGRVTGFHTDLPCKGQFTAFGELNGSQPKQAKR